MTILTAIAKAAQGNRDIPWDSLPEAAKQNWLNRVRPIADEMEKRMKPMIFSGPMVRALLDGSKTMTRRIIKPRGRCSLFDGSWTDSYVLDEGNAEWRTREIPFAIGDRLYVRETHYLTDDGDNECAVFAADTNEVKEHLERVAALSNVPESAKARHSKLRPSIHMPRWASRLTLEVTGVKVERLQDISEEDAKAEGCGLYVPGHGFITQSELEGDPGYSNFLSPRLGFEAIWYTINEKRAPWASNPWVVAVSFKVIKDNIENVIADEAERAVRELLEAEEA